MIVIATTHTGHEIGRLLAQEPEEAAEALHTLAECLRADDLGELREHLADWAAGANTDDVASLRTLAQGLLQACEPEQNS